MNFRYRRFVRSIIFIVRRTISQRLLRAPVLYFLQTRLGKYLDNGTDQGTAWQASSFDDSTWASGNAEFGYGDGGEATVVSYGPSPDNKYITTYFRKAFQVTNLSAYFKFTFDLIRDDGAAVYVNGTEVYRNNMPRRNDCLQHFGISRSWRRR